MIKTHQIDLDDPALYSIVNERQIECAAYAEDDRLLRVHAHQSTLDSQIFPYHDDDEKRFQRLKRERERENQRWERMVAIAAMKAAARPRSTYTDSPHPSEWAKHLHELLKEAGMHFCEWNYNVFHSSYVEGSPVNPVQCRCGAQAIFIRHPDGRVEFQAA